MEPVQKGSVEKPKKEEKSKPILFTSSLSTGMKSKTSEESKTVTTYLKVVEVNLLKIKTARDLEDRTKEQGKSRFLEFLTYRNRNG